MRRIGVLTLALAGLLVVAACSAQSGPPPTAAGAPAERAPLPTGTIGSY